MRNIEFYFYKSPIGYLLLSCSDGCMTGLSFVNTTEAPVLDDNAGVGLPAIMETCINQLDEYFAGKRRDFDVPLNNSGTPFRQRVWSELEKIPYGETVSYRDIAERINSPRSVRAVGGANHHNNISIIVPCHRVIGSNGELRGYGGEIWRKLWLLEHESKFKQ